MCLFKINNVLKIQVHVIYYQFIWKIHIKINKLNVNVMLTIFFTFEIVKYKIYLFRIELMYYYRLNLTYFIEHNFYFIFDIVNIISGGTCGVSNNLL